jgi:hypothetical protein
MEPVGLMASSFLMCFNFSFINIPIVRYRSVSKRRKKKKKTENENMEHGNKIFQENSYQQDWETSPPLSRAALIRRVVISIWLRVGTSGGLL